MRAGWLKEFFDRRIFNSATLFGVIPVGTAFGHWISKIIALPQLRKLAVGEIPWTPLRKSLSDSTVVLISTGGVHLRSDRPFNLNGDPTFRIIPKDARPTSLFHTRPTTEPMPFGTSTWCFRSSACASSRPSRSSGV